MGIVLVAISLGGVFNTVLLETRQRTREMAVLKAVGLTPAQVVAMVLASVVPVGLLAGLLGVPLGLAFQRAVLTYMGEVAAQTRDPGSDVRRLPAGAARRPRASAGWRSGPRRVPAGAARGTRADRPGPAGGVVVALGGGRVSTRMRARAPTSRLDASV